MYEICKEIMVSYILPECVLSKQLALLEILQNNPGEGEESRLQVRMAIEQAV